MSTGFAIAIAWPKTICKQAGAWYDPLMKWFGFNKNYYYRAGHAAVVLVNGETGECHYFDFGRYHAPFGHGRVRDKETDHELRIKTIALLNANGELTNFSEILSEINENKSCHGTGDIHASYCKINFIEAFLMAKKIQEKSPISYGPFILFGTNCSRFVKKILLSGKPGLIKSALLKFSITITPTPLDNVWSLDNYLLIRSK